MLQSTPGSPRWRPAPVRACVRAAWRWLPPLVTTLPLGWGSAGCGARGLGTGPRAIWHTSQTAIKRDISFPNKMAVVSPTHSQPHSLSASLTHSLAHLLNTSLPQRLARSLSLALSLPLSRSITLGLNLITPRYDTLRLAMPCCNAFLSTSKVQ